MTSRKPVVLAARSSAALAWRSSFFALGGGSSPNFGDPLPNLPSSLTTRFLAGQASFELVETVSAGLGPVFNDGRARRCMPFHARPQEAAAPPLKPGTKKDARKVSSTP